MERLYGDRYRCLWLGKGSRRNNVRINATRQLEIMRFAERRIEISVRWPRKCCDSKEEIARNNKHRTSSSFIPAASTTYSCPSFLFGLLSPSFLLVPIILRHFPLLALIVFVIPSSGPCLPFRFHFLVIFVRSLLLISPLPPPRAPLAIFLLIVRPIVLCLSRHQPEDRARDPINNSFLIIS